MQKTLINAFIWLLGSALAIAFAVVPIDSVFVDGSYLPYGNDAFYHARRILDAAFTESGLRQFDPMMHVPEGSWVPWSWAYDYLLAKYLQVATWLVPFADPMKLLVYVPVAWVCVNVALLLAIVSKVGLRLEFRAFTVAGFSILPITQVLHGVGSIDHHYMELTFVLLTFWLLLRWLSRPEDRIAAIVCGASFGIAQAFHHGLFILQLPMLATLFVLWLRGSLPRVAEMRAAGVAVFVSTLLVALPSGPFLDLQFSLSTLSWFHVYVAGGTMALLFYMSSKRYERGSLYVMVAICLILAIAPSAQIWLGWLFLTGNLPIIVEITELTSPFGMITGGWGLMVTVGIYSGLLMLVPVILVACAWLAATDTRPIHLAYGVFGVFGLCLLLAQYRLNYFGLCFLLSGPFYFVEKFIPVANSKRAVVALAAMLLFAFAFRAPLSGPLLLRHPVAGDHLYDTIRPLFSAMRDECATEPGTVVASHQFGNYIRFHTDCGVISNNFGLTTQHLNKVNEANSLFFLSPEKLAQQAPQVRYVLAFLANTHRQQNGLVFLRDMSDIRERNPLLNVRLLLDERKASNVEVIDEVTLDLGDGQKIVMAGVYKIVR